MISIIAAVARNRVIGKENDLPWRLPSDFRYFKSRTLGRPCLMARKTFESLDGALKKRINIVLTRNEGYEAEGAIVVHSIEEGLRVAREHLGEGEEIMILGGATLYEQILPQVDRMYITEVDLEPEGDATFPEYDREEWIEVEREEHEADERNECAYSFVVYDRREG